MSDNSQDQEDYFMQMIEQNPMFQTSEGGSQAEVLPSSQASMMSSSTSVQGLQIPSLWHSPSDFYRSLDSFLEKYRSTDSFKQRVAASSESCADEVEALREFLVSKSVAFDSTMSQEWVPHYKRDHEEVNPNVVFTQQSQLSQLSQEDVEHEAIAPASQNSTATTTNWYELLENSLPKASYGSAPQPTMTPSWARARTVGSSVVKSEPSTAEKDAAAALASASLLLRPPLPPPGPPTTEHSASPSESSSDGSGSKRHKARNSNSNRELSKGNRHKRKRQSARGKEGGLVKRYYKPTNVDVLCGRGGRTNHHPGNKVYLRLKEEIQARYLSASKNDKTAISQELVDEIHKLGGRFLEQDDATGDWFEVTAVKARKKASQTLREINTPEERKAKREKYGK